MDIKTPSYSYTDLLPLLDKAKENTMSISNINNSINNTWVHAPKTPKERDETVAQSASKNVRDAFKVERAEKDVDKLLLENQKLYKDYKDETDRRNGIVNRMWEIRKNINQRYNSNTKNRLASANMMRRQIKELRALREEASKFSEFLRGNNGQRKFIR